MLFRSNDTATTEIYTLSLHDALPIFTKDSIDPVRIIGLEDMMGDAVKFKYIPAPLTGEQLATLVQVPK